MVGSLEQASFAAIARALRTHDDFIVCGHVSPDGDCIGSVLGMTAILKALGKEVQPVVALKEPLDAALLSIPGASSLVNVSEAHSAATFISVDASGDDRLGQAACALRQGAQFTITLDHHEVSDCPADIFHIDPSAPSATCLVWEVAKAAGMPLGPELAGPCYTGLMTDTGRFQYQNADQRAFALASEMVATGISVSGISTAFYQTKTLAAVQMESLTAQHMELLGGGSVALSFLSQEDMDRYGANYADCEGAIDVLRSLGQVSVACILKVRGDEVRGSLRAKDGTDVAAIAGLFGGGGHKAAAGFTLPGPLTEAIVQVKAALQGSLGC